jgi:hypothetical protein
MGIVTQRQYKYNPGVVGSHIQCSAVHPPDTHGNGNGTVGTWSSWVVYVATHDATCTCTWVMSAKHDVMRWRWSNIWRWWWWFEHVHVHCRRTVPYCSGWCWASLTVTLHTANVTYQCSHARENSEQWTREQDCEQRTGEQRNSETGGHEWYYSDMCRTR